MKKYLVFLAALLILIPAGARGKYRPSLKCQMVADLEAWTPDSVKVKGSVQGFALHGKYAVVLHDKGLCCIYDMRKKTLAASYMLEGNTSHCNNANFGTEMGTVMPLLYISECRGTHCCYVTDVTLEGSRILQKIFYEGTDYPGSFDWALDTRNGFIYTYGGANGSFKLLKKFRLPTLADSDVNGEVHLTDEDVLSVSRFDEGINIWQGSIARGRYAYLPDGYPPHDRWIHVVDLETQEILASRNVNDLEIEPEGCDIRGRWLYVAFHTQKHPRKGKIYRFKIQ